MASASNAAAEAAAAAPASTAAPVAPAAPATGAPAPPSTSTLPSTTPVVRSGLFGQKFEVRTIAAMRRSATGSKLAQWARKNALIPGVVYGFDAEGREQVELVYVREGDLRKEVNQRGECFLNTLYDIEIDGVKQRVLPRDFQVHPFRPKAISINWLRYRPGAYPGARIDIPLKPFNEERCPAFKEGGWLFELVDKMPVYAFGEDIPDYLMMDLRAKRVGDRVMASHIDLNEGLTLRSRVRDFAVAKFLGSRRGEGTEEAAGASGAAAGAAGGAAGGTAAAAGGGAAGGAAKPAAGGTAAAAAGKGGGSGGGGGGGSAGAKGDKK